MPSKERNVYVAEILNNSTDAVSYEERIMSKIKWGMTKDDIINIFKRKKKEAIEYSDVWANKPASNSQDKLLNECWSSWNDGQAKAFELAISIVSMLDNPHNRSSEKINKE